VTQAAAPGARDLYHVDECGFVPTVPTSDTETREGTHPLVPDKAPPGRRVKVSGALATAGPTPRRVWASRRSGQGSLESAAFLDFVAREGAQLPASWDALPPDSVRERPGTIVLDTYSVHRSTAVQAAAPVLAQPGVTGSFWPPAGRQMRDIEPVWRHVRYTDPATRSFADGATVHAAGDTALAERAAALCHPPHNFSRLLRQPPVRLPASEPRRQAPKTTSLGAHE
jgi:hypothetical protein